MQCGITCGLWAIALHGIMSPVFFNTFTNIYNTFMDVLAGFVVLHYEQLGNFTQKLLSFLHHQVRRQFTPYIA